MTAEHVNGLKVVESEPLMSPVKTPHGKPVYFRRIVTLLLEDGSTMLGCTECDYTDAAAGRVRHHLTINHWNRDVPRKLNGFEAAANDRRHAASTAVDTATLSVADLLNSATRLQALSDAVARMTEERNEWKARALKAERAMATLRKLVGGESS